MRVYFLPPEFDENGEPSAPFEFRVSSKTFVFLSPHRYWRKVVERVPMGQIVNSKTGQPIRDKDGNPILKYTLASRWELDESKNELLDAGAIAPPDNALDLSDGQLGAIGAHHPQIRQFLRTERDLENETRTSVGQLRRKQADVVAAKQAEIDAMNARMADLLSRKAKQIAALEAEVATLEAGAKELAEADDPA